MENQRVSLSIQLPEKKFQELAEMSLRTGILKSNLVRNWIFEKLEEEQKQKLSYC